MIYFASILTRYGSGWELNPKRKRGNNNRATEWEKESKNRLKAGYMKKTTSSREYHKELGKMKYNIAMSLSKFTAIMMGEPENYKSKAGFINYYPSDCLNNWRYSTINKDGQIVNDPTKQPEAVAGIICKGNRRWNDEPQEITVMFKDI